MDVGGCIINKLCGCMYNGRMIVYACQGLLTNCLRGKAAELCLALTAEITA